MCREWQMKGRMRYNEGKTKALFMELGRRIRPPVMRVGEAKIECDDWVNLMGVYGCLWSMQS